MGSPSHLSQKMDLAALQVVRSKDGEGTQLGLECTQLLSQSGVYILPSFTLSFLLLTLVEMEKGEEPGKSFIALHLCSHLIISHNIIRARKKLWFLLVTSEEVNGHVLLTLVYRLWQYLLHSDKFLSFVA